MEKTFKITIEVITLLVVTSMALATGWLGWETRQLKITDLGPNINVADVSLELIDETGTLIKDRSWQKGELYQPEASSKDIEEVIVKIKFSNTGKNAGYVRVLNYKDIIEKINSKQASEEVFTNNFMFVPAQDQTGWMYIVDVKKFFAGNNLLEIDYEIETYSIDKEKVSEYTISVSCSFPEVSPGKVNASCKPVGK